MPPWSVKTITYKQGEKSIFQGGGHKMKTVYT